MHFRIFVFFCEKNKFASQGPKTKICGAVGRRDGRHRGALAPSCPKTYFLTPSGKMGGSGGGPRVEDSIFRIFVFWINNEIIPKTHPKSTLAKKKWPRLFEKFRIFYTSSHRRSRIGRWVWQPNRRTLLAKCTSNCEILKRCFKKW